MNEKYEQSENVWIDRLGSAAAMSKLTKQQLRATFRSKTENMWPDGGGVF